MGISGHVCLVPQAVRIAETPSDAAYFYIVKFMMYFAARNMPHAKTMPASYLDLICKLYSIK